jgi:hypothetical protein
MKSFSADWCALIHNLVSRGSVAIKFNTGAGNYLHMKKELRPGDPLFPMLFNIVDGMLIFMIEHAKNDGQIEGVVPHLR